MILDHRPTPLAERTESEISVMLSPDQVSAQIKQILNCGMCGHKSLGLLHGSILVETGNLTCQHPGIRTTKVRR